MVKVCSLEYPKDGKDEYVEYFNFFKYELHDFQKWSIEAIVTGNHVLITAPTGSGKTVPGEFALDFFHNKGKKTIYCSPIKALSNQKFHDFTNKYPQISIGIITGDIRCNPDAELLIVTTEILLNKLYQNKNAKQATTNISFEMDIENDLGCVIFDEIHYINDESRGFVWENSIMLLPSQIQIIGLSATLDNPEKFSNWIETRGTNNKIGDKVVYLAKKMVRSVPLIHYSFIVTTNGVNKIIKDKAIQEEIRIATNKPLVIQGANNVFDDIQYQHMNKILKLFDKYEIKIKRQHVLNKVAEYLVENKMLPALCYVFSRKQLEKFAEELTTNLLEDDSKIPYTIDYECEQIIRKLANYEEYLHLPEYINTVKLLRKGVGIHHSGLMPVLREMTELLFSKGFIKILFCTETVSVGVNLPIKTTIFTDVNKFNGEIIRMLYSHEYTQSAGRAGRLGLDTVGYVIHLNNLFRNVDSVSYKQMMNNKPQTLVSKFKISYNLLLNLLLPLQNLDEKMLNNLDTNLTSSFSPSSSSHSIPNIDLVHFISKSMATGDLNNQMTEITQKISILQQKNNTVNNFKTPIDTITEYLNLITNIKVSVNKKRKEMERKIQFIKDNHRYIEQDLLHYQLTSNNKEQIIELQNQYNSLNSYFITGIQNVLSLLKEKEFINGDINNESSLKLTLLGHIACNIREIHCLVFAKLYQDTMFYNLSSKQLIALFSCFTNIRVTDDFKDNVPSSNDVIINNVVKEVKHMYIRYKDEEIINNINTGFDYEMHYDLLNYVEKWCDCETKEECKFLLQELAANKEIFLGEFVKALLKINNISCEMEKIAEMTCNIDFLSKLKNISKMTLKYVVTNQSLYV